MAADADPRVGSLAARRRAYKGISFGTTLICVGVVLLLNTLGRVGWGVWFDLLRLWPLLLISVGLRVIFVPTRLHPLAILGPLMVVTATVLAVSWYRGVPGDRWEPSGGEALHVSCPAPLRGAPARLRLEFAAGRLGLISERAAQEAPSAPGAVVPVRAATGPAAAGWSGVVRYEGNEPPWECGNDGDLWLGTERGEDGLRFVFPFATRHDRWEARLSSPVPVAVRGALVAATAHLDLRAFDLDHVGMDLAATNARLRLGAPARRVGVRFDGVASQVRLRLPAGTCFTITREPLFSVLSGEALPPGHRRGRRVVGDACPPGDLPDELPRYEFRFEMPFSTVVVETDDGA